MWIPGSDLRYAGTYGASINDADTTSFSVSADTIDEHGSSIGIRSGSIRPGEEAIVSVQMRDRFGNPLSGRAAQLLSDNSTDIIKPITRETDANGEQRFGLTAHENGNRTLRAVDLISGTVIAESAKANIGGIGGYVAYAEPATERNFYPGTPSMGANLLGNALTAQTAGFQQLDHFEIVIRNKEASAIPKLKINEPESMTVTAIDQNGKQFFGYQGTVYLFSTDPSAQLPKDGVMQFTFQDQGIKQYTLGLTFRTPGTHTLAVSASANDVNVSLGSLDVEVTGQVYTQPNRSISISEPRPGQLFNKDTITVSGTGPAFINIVIKGGKEDVTAETDRDGKFSVQMKLDTTKTEFTIHVSDSDGRYESEPRTFGIDVTPPTIESVTFSPENPEEGTDVLMVAVVSNDAKEVTVDVDGDTKPMTKMDDGSGKYQVLLTAPAAGVYAPTVTATDAQGNAAKKSGALPVEPKGIPIVDNLVAEGQINAVGLRWDPVTSEEIDAYRIYVGVPPELPGDPVEFLYTLDTDRPTAAATVAGLKPGTVYFFGVTALKNGRESKEKSNIAKTVVLGVQLEVTPQDGALLIEWTALQNNMPLSSFQLEYGTDPTTLTERRILNGELRAYTLRDLINGVTYHLKLTPITTTGESITDLAATGQGTPTGRGFTVSPSDPVPPNLRASAPPSPPTPAPPQNTGTGIPSIALWCAVLVSMAIFGIYLKRRKSTQTAVAFLNTMEGRYRSGGHF